MTFENSKRLYEHYSKIGKDDAAKNLALKYPELEGTQKEEVKEEEEVKEDKPKKKQKK